VKCIVFDTVINCKIIEKSAQREANTARALAVVRFGHRPPVANKQTGPITIHCAAKLSAQCDKYEVKWIRYSSSSKTVRTHH